MIYGVTSSKLIFLAKLYSAGRRRHGNAVSVNFIKCVRRVRDTVNSAAAYIEFSCLNGNLSHHITRCAFFKTQILSISFPEYTSSFLSYSQLCAFVRLIAHLYLSSFTKSIIHTLIYYHYTRNIQNDDILSIETKSILFVIMKKKSEIYTNLLHEFDFMCHALLTNYWMRTVA